MFKSADIPYGKKHVYLLAVSVERIIAMFPDGSLVKLLVPLCYWFKITSGTWALFKVAFRKIRLIHNWFSKQETRASHARHTSAARNYYLERIWELCILHIFGTYADLCAFFSVDLITDFVLTRIIIKNRNIFQNKLVKCVRI